MRTFILAAALIATGLGHNALAKEIIANPVVSVETNLGSFEIELFADQAPISVANFLAYVDAGFYDGTLFHRVVKGFVVQGGGFDLSGAQKQTRAPIRNEANNGLKNEKGTVAMARTSDPHSATSQFFINVARHKMLDYRGDQAPNLWGYAVFGKIRAGWEIVAKIESVPVGSEFLGEPKRPMRNVPTDPVVVIKINRLEPTARPTATGGD
ncbi:MAG: peptidylprolyl isomerase [Pseudomonadota bacterium]